MPSAAAASEREAVWRRALLWLLLAGALARLLLGWLLPWSYGESYYLASTRLLALSWFDQPPLALWLIGASRWLLGESPLLLRLPEIALFAVTTWLLARWTAGFFGPRAGFLAALLLNLSAVFGFSAGLLLQPDGLFFLLWLLAAQALWRAFGAEAARAWRAWLLAGLLLGLCLLSKYPAALLAAGAGIYLLTQPRARRWLLHPAPYAAALLVLALQAPVLIWNAENDWVSFAFQGGRAGQEGALDWGRFLGAIAGQAAWVLPWVWLPLVWAFVAALRQGPRVALDWYLACLALPTLLLFTLVALWSPIGLHFHWQAPGYLLLLPLAGRLLDRLLERRPRLGGGLVKGAVAASLLTFLLAGGHLIGGWFTPLLPPRLAALDDTRESIDWTPLRDLLAAEGLLDRPDVILVTNRWHQAGKADAAIQGRLPVLCLCADPRNLAFGRDQAAHRGATAVILANPEFLKQPPQVYGGQFAAMEPWRQVILGRGGRAEIVLTLWRAEDFRATYPMPYGP